MVKFLWLLNTAGWVTSPGGNQHEPTPTDPAAFQLFLLGCKDLGFVNGYLHDEFLTAFASTIRKVASYYQTERTVAMGMLGCTDGEDVEVWERIMGIGIY